MCKPVITKLYKLATFPELIIAALLVTNFPVNSQPLKSLRISRYDLSYVIKDSLSGILEEVNIEGRSTGSGNNVFIPFESLTRLEEPVLEVKRNNGTWKKYKKIQYKDQEVNFEHFYSDDRIRKILLPEDSEFRLKMNLVIGDIFLFPPTPLISPYSIDTLNINLK